MDPKEGDRVTFVLKSVSATGTVVKRTGIRVRIANGDGERWAELKDITEVLGPEAAAPAFPAAAATVSRLSTPQL